MTRLGEDAKGPVQVTVSYDLVSKKGKRNKRVTIGVILQDQGQVAYGNALHRKNGKLLKKQVRKLTKVGSKTKMSGPGPL